MRAKAPRVVAHLTAFHGVMHALPLTYNKDLQEDKEHLFDAVDTLELTLAAATAMVAGVRFRRDRLREAAGDELSPPPTSPTCSCVSASPSARRTGWSRASCARRSTPAGRCLS